MIQTTKIEELLALFLYEHGYLQMPQLGTFHLQDYRPGAEDYPSPVPDDKITFSWNPSEALDEALVAFITARTGKMRVLAIADLRSICDQAKEMLNMRQSYNFSGIGTIKMDTKGMVALLPASLTEHTTITEPRQKSAAPLTKSKARGRKNARLVFIILVLLIAGACAYLFIWHKTGGDNIFTQHQASTPPPATQMPGNDSAAVAMAPDNPDTARGSIHYEVVFETSHKERALYRYQQLTGWGHHIVMHTQDSAIFTLAVPFTTPPADTAAMKDSIQVFYGRPVYIRYQ